MFLVDNLLATPGQAALFVFKELARKAQEDWLNDDAVKQELQEIYTLVEAGKISTQDFEARECRLLERLEQIARARYHNKWTQEDGTVIEGEAVVQTIDTALSDPPRLIEPSPIVEGPPVIDGPQLKTPGPREPRALGAPPVVAPPPVLQVSPMIEPPRPVVASPPPIAPPAALPVQPALSITQVVQATSRALSLLNLKLSVITSVSPEDGGWKVTAELVERRGVPDTNDLIGIYDVRLDAAGDVTRYERTRMRRRGDIGR